MKPKIRIKESELQASIIQWLIAKRFMWWRNNTGGMMSEGGHFVRFGSTGSPDIFVVRAGICIGIEVKGTPGGKQSLEQKGFQEKLEEAGGTYILAYSMEDVTEHYEFYTYD